MNDIIIIDNFLDSFEFEELKTKMHSQHMLWSYSNILTKDNFIEILCNDLDNHIMTHLMYDQFCPLSDCFYWMKPIFDSAKMDIKSLVRVKANLYFRTNESHILTDDVLESSHGVGFHIPANGYLYETDNSLWHTAVNTSTEETNEYDRVHILFDEVLS